jgi:SAM-dependent methyltransferase
MAESFGTDPDRYDRVRPRYPDDLVTAVVSASPGADVLDVGIGTGIAARQFRAAGCRVLGVEVDARMAEFSRRHGLEVEVAAFEAWEPAGRVFDAVVSGQTWHWVDPVAGAVKAAQVLRPGGRLAAFWNLFRPPPRVAVAFAAAYQRALPTAPWNPWNRPALDAYTRILDRAADGIRAAGAFDEPERWSFAWERSYGRDEWLEQTRTSGDAGQLTAAQLDALLDATGDAIDGIGGGFTMGYDAVVLTASTRAAPHR